MFDLKILIETFGYAGLFAIVFAETGLLFGFFLPGDSLLITAGILASQGMLNIYLLAPILFVAAVLGDSVGYAFGHKIGKRIFSREDSLLFHKENIARAQKFYEKHGKKTIVLARFIPIIRTFAPIVAGIGEMHYLTFLSYNVIGGLLWAVGITLAGFALGESIPQIEDYLLPIIGTIIFLSVLPPVYGALNTGEKRRKLFDFAKECLKTIRSARTQ